jgi:hypothetical protein
MYGVDFILDLGENVAHRGGETACVQRNSTRGAIFK